MTDDLGLAEELNASAKAIIDFARSEHTPARIFGYATERLWHIANLAALRSPSAVREAIEQCAQICRRISINAERRAADHTNVEAKQAALDKCESARECEQAILALASSPVVGRTEWQDIETAPRDKSVLVVDRGAVSEAYYNGESDTWWLANTSEHDFDHASAIYPLLWQPLPTPPSETKDAAVSRPHLCTPPSDRGQT